MILSLRKDRRVIDIPIVQIRPCKTQTRKKYSHEQLMELAWSIKNNGIIQPLTVRKVSSVEYELVAGERRLRAAALCGKTRVPCIVITCTDSQAVIYSLAENLQRTELNIFEEAQGITDIINSCNISRQEAARQLGKQQAVIDCKLRILKFNNEEREIIIKAHLNEKHARALLKIQDPVERRFALSEIVEKNMNVSQTESYINECLCRTKQEKRRHQRRKAVIKDIRIFENTINNAVETMNSSGINAEAHKSENEDYIEYVVRIPKSRLFNINLTA